MNISSRNDHTALLSEKSVFVEASPTGKNFPNSQAQGSATGDHDSSDGVALHEKNRSLVSPNGEAVHLAPVKAHICRFDVSNQDKIVKQTQEQPTEFAESESLLSPNPDDFNLGEFKKLSPNKSSQNTANGKSISPPHTKPVRDHIVV